MLQNVHDERGLNKIFLDVNKCLMHQNSKNIGTNQGYYQLSLMSVFDSSSSVKWYLCKNSDLGFWLKLNNTSLKFLYGFGDFLKYA